MNQKIKNKFNQLWFSQVLVEPVQGKSMSELVDETDDSGNKVTYENSRNLNMAYINLLIKADNEDSAKKILPQGLAEKEFNLLGIEDFDNLYSLYENYGLNDVIIAEAKWLLSSEYVFKIIEPIYPFDGNVG
jgi:hypothetical protein